MPALSSDDLHAITALHDRWLELERSGKASAILDLCTDDVVWLPPGSRPLRGRDTILHWLSGPPIPVLALESSHLAIAGQGDAAWKTCEFITTLKPSAAEDPVTVLGAQLWVLTRQPGAPWRIAVASWTQR